MADDSILKIILRFITDRASLDAAKQSIQGAEKATVGLAKETKSAGKAANEFSTGMRVASQQSTATTTTLRQTSEAFRGIAVAAGAAGAAITGPLLLSGQAYIAWFGRSEAASRSWLQSTSRLEDANRRLGRVVVETIVPGLEQAATFAEQLAGIAEANPWLVQGGLTGGGALLGVAALGVAAAQITTMVKGVRSILVGAQGISATFGAAEAAGGASAGLSLGASAVALGGLGVLGAATSSLELAKNAALSAIMDAIAKTTTGQELADMPETAQLALKMYKALVIALSGGSFLNFALDMAGIVQNSKPAGGTPNWDEINKRGTGPAGDYQSFARSLAASFQQAIPLYQAYQDKVIALETETGKRRQDIILAYSANLLKLDEDYAKQRARIAQDNAKSETRRLEDYHRQQGKEARDFARNEAETEASYYADRMKRARDFGVEAQRDEEDHQRDMQSMSADHAERVRDLAGSRDALGLAREQRSYERQRKEAEDNYQTQQKRKNADYARDLDDAEKAFSDQRAQRLDDYERRLQDEKEAFALETQRRQSDYAQTLRDLKDHFNDQKVALTLAFGDQMGAIDKFHDDAKLAYDAAFVAQLNQLNAHLTGQFNMQTKAQAQASLEFKKFLDSLTGQVTGEGDPYCAPGYHWDAKKKACVADKTGKEPHVVITPGVGAPSVSGPAFVSGNSSSTTAAERLLSGPMSNDRILANLARSNAFSVDVGGINIEGGGGQAMLNKLLAVVDERITASWNDFDDALDTLQ
jgi:hypothetical protein